MAAYRCNAFNFHFYSAASMQGGLNHERMVVHLSVHKTRELSQNERNQCQYYYTTRKTIHPSIVARRIAGGGRPLQHEILDQTDSVGAKAPIFNQYLAIALQP